MMTNAHNGILYIIYPLAMTLVKYIFMKNSQCILNREHKVLYIWSHFFMEKNMHWKPLGKIHTKMLTGWKVVFLLAYCTRTQQG